MWPLPWVSLDWPLLSGLCEFLPSQSESLTQTGRSGENAMSAETIQNLRMQRWEFCWILKSPALLALLAWWREPLSPPKSRHITLCLLKGSNWVNCCTGIDCNGMVALLVLTTIQDVPTAPLFLTSAFPCMSHLTAVILPAHSCNHEAPIHKTQHYCREHRL